MKLKTLQLRTKDLLPEYASVQTDSIKFSHFNVPIEVIQEADVVSFLDQSGRMRCLKDRLHVSPTDETKKAATKESTEIQQGSYIVVPKLNGSYEANVLKVTAASNTHIVAVNAHNNFAVFFFSLSELKEIGYIAFEAGSDIASLTLAAE